MHEWKESKEFKIHKHKKEMPYRYSAVVKNRIKNIEAAYKLHGDKNRAKTEVLDLQKRLRKVLDRDSNSGKAKRVGYKKII